MRNKVINNNNTQGNSGILEFRNDISSKIKGRLLNNSVRFPNNFYIYGDPLIGKTALLRQLLREIESEKQLADLYIPLWIDLDRLTDNNELIFWRFLADQLFEIVLESSIKKEFTDRFERLNDGYQRAVESKEFYEIRQVYVDSLKLLNLSTKKKILLFIDNFQKVIVEFDDVKSVLSKLHGDYESVEQPVIYIISSSDSLEELEATRIRDEAKRSNLLPDTEAKIRATAYSKFASIFNYEIVTPLNADSAREMIKTHLANNYVAGNNDELVEEIFEMTGGLPSLITTVCQEITKNNFSGTLEIPKTISENLKLKLLNNLKARGYLENLWLKAQENEVLIDILAFINIQQNKSVNLDDVICEFPNEYVQSLLTRLSDSGWLVETETDKYRISSIFIQSFIDRKFSESNKIQIKTERSKNKQESFPNLDIQIDHDNQEVVSYGERKKLSDLEYKLLKSLTGNPNTPRTREELSQDLWGKEVLFDDKVRTNLDQIVKRLRRKVEAEEDLDSPKIIQSVRNQGYMARL